MSNIVIKATDISKQYRLGVVGSGSLKDDVGRFFAKITGKEDPTLKVGEINDRTQKADSDYVWALKNINFEVRQGEILGVIGKNGAGKSTLLKILSKITAPTTGSIKVRGRIASLLEVGTGFHAELTGRENVYLNGAILGMRREEVTRKLDEIIDFAGIARYIDTPVKRYSSGMTVRLGFAVAAHLEPEILVVDEVLAVGDAEFQKKAIGKMQDVSRDGGRTVLFVSHNMTSIQNLCTRSLVLENGSTVFEGTTHDAINYYLRQNEQQNLVKDIVDRSGTQQAIFNDFYVEDQNHNRIETALSGNKLYFVFDLLVKDFSLKKIDLGFSIHNELGDTLSIICSGYRDVFFSSDGDEIIKIKCEVVSFPFTSGTYYIKGRLTDSNGREIDYPKETLGKIDVLLGNYYSTGSNGSNGIAPVLLNENWIIQ